MPISNRFAKHVNYGLVMVSLCVGYLLNLLLNEPKFLHIFRGLAALGHSTHAVLNLLETQKKEEDVRKKRVKNKE